MVTFLDGGTPVITGTDTITTPGGYQFAVTGGNGPYTWSVTGTGVSINSSGYVTLDGACGMFYVTCTDCTGRNVSHAGTRVTNAGSWHGTGSGGCLGVLESGRCDTSMYCGGTHYGLWCTYKEVTLISGGTRIVGYCIDGVQGGSPWQENVEACYDSWLVCLSTCDDILGCGASGRVFTTGSYWYVIFDNVPDAWSSSAWTC